MTVTFDADRRWYKVQLRGLWDEDDRLTLRLKAYGERDIRNQVREFYRDYACVDIQPTTAPEVAA